MYVCINKFDDKAERERERKRERERERERDAMSWPISNNSYIDITFVFGFAIMVLFLTHQVIVMFMQKCTVAQIEKYLHSHPL